MIARLDNSIQWNFLTRGVDSSLPWSEDLDRTPNLQTPYSPPTRQQHLAQIKLPPNPDGVKDNLSIFFVTKHILPLGGSFALLVFV